jgi:hypothetical protein
MTRCSVQFKGALVNLWAVTRVFTYGLFNDAVSSTDCVESDDNVTYTPIAGERQRNKETTAIAGQRLRKYSTTRGSTMALNPNWKR